MKSLFDAAAATEVAERIGRLGPMPDEWAVRMYKHVDHHLRPFGA